MAAKDKIKEVYPRAYSEKYKANAMAGDKRTYYLIWSSRLRDEKIRLGEGDTEAKAWKDAMYWIENE
jgi:hypothetical protein